MARPILYELARLAVAVGLRGYFGRVEVDGRGNLPPGGPVVFAANHPHSITDALVLGHGVERMLHFVAHSGLFRPAWKGWFLRHSGVIPVYRPSDQAGAAQKNRAMFEACEAVLCAGGAIGIFPEGTSSEERRVGHLKTGTARLAFGAEAAGAWRTGVVIVPVGLNFESRRRFRSSVLVRFGRPIAVGERRGAYEADPESAVRALTADLEDALRREVVNIAQDEYVELVRDIQNIYKDDLLGRAELGIAGQTRFQRDQTVRREIPRALDWFHRNRPEALWSLSRQMRRYNRKRRLLRLRDEMLRTDRGPSMRGELGRFAAVGLLGLAPAAVGAVGNLPPYRLTGWLSGKLAPDLTKAHTYQFILGTLLFVPWYWLVLRFVLAARGLAWTIAAGLLLPPLGLFARWYIAYLTGRRRQLRFAGLEVLQGVRIQELRQQRQSLIRELDDALQAYLEAREETP